MALTAEKKVGTYPGYLQMMVQILLHGLTAEPLQVAFGNDP